MTYNTPNSVWTNERVDHLKALWAAGELSCAGIAAELGGGISRNAVIGKGLRLGLAKKSTAGPAAQRVSKSKQPRARRTIHKVGQASFVPRDDEEQQDIDVSSLTKLEAQTPPPTFLGIPLIGLEPKHCRYPRTIEGATLFCGQPRIEDSRYCAECHRRCHTGNFGRTSSYVIRRRAA